jgi:hypothetical protein
MLKSVFDLWPLEEIAPEKVWHLQTLKILSKIRALLVTSAEYSLVAIAVTQSTHCLDSVGDRHRLLCQQQNTARIDSIAEETLHTTSECLGFPCVRPRFK